MVYLGALNNVGTFLAVDFAIHLLGIFTKTVSFVTCILMDFSHIILYYCVRSAQIRPPVSPCKFLSPDDRLLLISLFHFSKIKRKTYEPFARICK